MGLEAQLILAVGEEVRDPGLVLDAFLGPGVAVNDHGDGHDVAAGLAHALDGGERRPTRGGGVLENNHVLTLDARSLDLTAHAIRLLRLTDHEGIDRTIGIAGGVHDGGAHRVGAHGQTAHVSEVELGSVEHLQHDLADEGCSLVVQGDATQVDVVVGLLAGGQSDLATDDGKFLDKFFQTLAGDRFAHTLDSNGHPSYADAMNVTRPLGFWLKLVDSLIDEHFAATLEEHGVTRRQWQLLNLLEQRPAAEKELIEALAPFFVSADEPPSVKEHVAELAESGWITFDGEMYSITERGHTSFTKLSELVESIRNRCSEGLSAEQYTTTLASLEQMAKNLGWEDPQSEQQ